MSIAPRYENGKLILPQIYKSDGQFFDACIGFNSVAISELSLEQINRIRLLVEANIDAVVRMQNFTAEFTSLDELQFCVDDDDDSLIPQVNKVRDATRSCFMSGLSAKWQDSAKKSITWKGDNKPDNVFEGLRALYDEFHVDSIRIRNSEKKEFIPQFRPLLMTDDAMNLLESKYEEWKKNLNSENRWPSKFKTVLEKKIIIPDDRNKCLEFKKEMESLYNVMNKKKIEDEFINVLRSGEEKNIKDLRNLYETYVLNKITKHIKSLEEKFPPPSSP